jgi:hypothetical protein
VDTAKSLPQLQTRENMLSAKSGKILAATQTDFSPDGFRSSSPTTPVSQSGARNWLSLDSARHCVDAAASSPIASASSWRL